MIFNLIINFLFGIVTVLFSILPTGGSLPVSFTNGLSTLFMLVRSMSFILPLDTLAICVPLAFAWVLFVFAWDFFHWLIKKLPFLHMK